MPIYKLQLVKLILTLIIYPTKSSHVSQSSTLKYDQLRNITCHNSPLSYLIDKELPHHLFLPRADLQDNQLSSSSHNQHQKLSSTTVYIDAHWSSMTSPLQRLNACDTTSLHCSTPTRVDLKHHYHCTPLMLEKEPNYVNDAKHH